jgi:hemolysin III
MSVPYANIGWSILAAATANQPGRLADGGPIYLETDLTQTIVEPFNTATAVLFVLLAGMWAIALRGRFRQRPFLTFCLPILLVGGVGGTIWHATRTSRVWLMMDWMPIAVLCVASAIYLLSKLLEKRWPYAFAVIPLFWGFQMLNWNVIGSYSKHAAIGIGYSSMALLILLPAIGVLLKTHWRNGAWTLGAVICFALAMTFRSTDRAWPDVVPMGTHFLWHAFGLLACHCMIEYLDRLPPALEVARGQGSVA